MPRRKNGPPRDPSKIKLRPGYTLRKCMSCTQPFASEWIGNRLCDPCKHSPRAAADAISFTGRHVAAHR